MKWIRSLALVAAMLVAFVFAALFVNQQEIALTFAIWTTPAASLFWWLLGAFMLGLGFGLVNGVWMNFKYRMKNRRLRMELANAVKELERVKTYAVQGTQP